MAVVSFLKAVLTLDNSGFKKGLSDSKKETASFGSTIGKIGGLIGVAFSAKAIIDFGRQMANLQNRTQNVSRAFERFGNALFLENLRRSTGNMVSDLDLMQQAVKAVNYGIEANDLADYFRFATIRAKETGESVDYLVNSIVLGIGRKSALVLDNLGISAARIQAEFKKTGDFAEAAGILIRQEMAKSETSIEDVTSEVTKLGAEWADFEKVVAEGGGGFFQGIAGAFASILRDLTALIAILTFNTDYFAEKLETTVLTYREAIDKMPRWMQEVYASQAGGAYPGFYVTLPLNQIAPTKKKKDEEPERLDGLTGLPALFEFPDKPATDWLNYLSGYVDYMTGSFDPAMILVRNNLELTAEQMRKVAPTDEEIKSVKKFGESFEKLNLDMTQFAAQGIALASQALGEMISGDTERAMETFIQGIAGLMKQFGSLLIAWGVAQLAIKLSVSNPYVAIAAGAALVAIGGLMSASQSKVTGSVGGGYTGSYGGSYGGGYVGSYDYNREITLVARGPDLVATVDYTRNRNYQNGL